MRLEASKTDFDDTNDFVPTVAVIWSNLRLLRSAKRANTSKSSTSSSVDKQFPSDRRIALAHRRNIWHRRAGIDSIAPTGDALHPSLPTVIDGDYRW